MPASLGARKTMMIAQPTPITRLRSATEMLLSDGVILLGAALLFVILFRRFGVKTTVSFTGKNHG